MVASHASPGSAWFGVVWWTGPRQAAIWGEGRGGGGKCLGALSFFFFLATSRCRRLELGTLIDGSIVVEVGRCKKSLRCLCRERRRFWRGRRSLVRGRCSLSLDSGDERMSGRGEQKWWKKGLPCISCWQPDIPPHHCSHPPIPPSPHPYPPCCPRTHPTG